ncbi:hypothetical protein BDN72DRAFT_91830 [Pluteus cervinus]|uniref:Uncharacterized protein n=1 Tax=Pluteus cervinus TaxID=181527 RepID=A0ACD3ARP3_9AGAR|nr:hypothetical protein BDN72DRAFT_91830 [Pluteus cervinus]
MVIDSTRIRLHQVVDKTFVIAQLMMPRWTRNFWYGMAACMVPSRANDQYSQKHQTCPVWKRNILSHNHQTAQDAQAVDWALWFDAAVLKDGEEMDDTKSRLTMLAIGKMAPIWRTRSREGRCRALLTSDRPCLHMIELLKHKACMKEAFRSQRGRKSWTSKALEMSCAPPFSSPF